MTNNGLLSDLIHLVSLTDNLYVKNRLEEIQDIVNNEPNYYLLGEKLKRLL